jgi:hypothetical protein
MIYQQLQVDPRQVRVRMVLFTLFFSLYLAGVPIINRLPAVWFGQPLFNKFPTVWYGFILVPILSLWFRVVRNAARKKTSYIRWGRTFLSIAHDEKLETILFKAISGLTVWHSPDGLVRRLRIKADGEEHLLFNLEKMDAFTRKLTRKIKKTATLRAVHSKIDWMRPLPLGLVLLATLLIFDLIQLVAVLAGVGKWFFPFLCVISGGFSLARLMSLPKSRRPGLALSGFYLVGLGSFLVLQSWDHGNRDWKSTSILHLSTPYVMRIDRAYYHSKNKGLEGFACDVDGGLLAPIRQKLAEKMGARNPKLQTLDVVQYRAVTSDFKNFDVKAWGFQETGDMAFDEKVITAMERDEKMLTDFLKTWSLFTYQGIISPADGYNIQQGVSQTTLSTQSNGNQATLIFDKDSRMKSLSFLRPDGTSINYFPEFVDTPDGYLLQSIVLSGNPKESALSPMKEALSFEISYQTINGFQVPSLVIIKIQKLDQTPVKTIKMECHWTNWLLKGKATGLLNE